MSRRARRPRRATWASRRWGGLLRAGWVRQELKAANGLRAGWRPQRVVASSNARPGPADRPTWGVAADLGPWNFCFLLSKQPLVKCRWRPGTQPAQPPKQRPRTSALFAELAGAISIQLPWRWGRRRRQRPGSLLEMPLTTSSSPAAAGSVALVIWRAAAAQSHPGHAGNWVGKKPGAWCSAMPIWP